MILKHQNIHWNGFDLFLTVKENLSRTEFHDCNFKQKYIYLKKDKEMKWTNKMKHPVFYKNENFFLANKFLVCFLACVKKKTTTGEEGKEDNRKKFAVVRFDSKIYVINIFFFFIHNSLMYRTSNGP